MFKMIKALIFVVSMLSVLSPSVGESDAGTCKTETMNKLCYNYNLVDRCYECTQMSSDVTECVPVFHNNLGTLEKYSRNEWNCTLYRPQDYIEQEEEHLDFSEDKFVKDICNVDELIYELCDEEDKNGFCMIASYIHDLCEDNEEEHDSNHMETQNYHVSDYISPWGSKSECMTKDYKEICSDRVTKSCFDCRTPTLLSYFHLCFPLFASENENALVTRLKKDKWECKKFTNPKFKPSKLYSACSGSICQKEGWQFQKTDFGKDWCGQGECKAFNRAYYCSFPTNCSKKVNSVAKTDEFQRNFETLSCGGKKLKCMLKKSCRNLVKQLDDCDKDVLCIFNVMLTQGPQNDTFQDLVKCMLEDQSN